MTTPTKEALAQLRLKAEKATKGEWWSDSVGNEGTYGSGDDCVEGFTSYAVYDENNQILLDTLNSSAACIQEEYDGEGHIAWDEVGQRNTEFIAAANPATVLALLDDIAELQSRAESAEQALLLERQEIITVNLPEPACAADFILPVAVYTHEAIIDCLALHPRITLQKGGE